MTQRRRPRRPKIVLVRFFLSLRFLASTFDHFLSDLGLILGGFGVPKSIMFRIEISLIFARRSKSGPRAAMGGPRAAKGGTRAARRGPRATKSGPIAAQERPRAAKSGQKRPKSGQERLLLSGSLSNKRCHKSAASAVRPLQYTRIPEGYYKELQ